MFWHRSLVHIRPSNSLFLELDDSHSLPLFAIVIRLNILRLLVWCRWTKYRNRCPWSHHKDLDLQKRWKRESNGYRLMRQTAVLICCSQSSLLCRRVDFFLFALHLVVDNGDGLSSYFHTISSFYQPFFFLTLISSISTIFNDPWGLCCSCVSLIKRILLVRDLFVPCCTTFDCVAISLEDEKVFSVTVIPHRNNNI